MKRRFVIGPMCTAAARTHPVLLFGRPGRLTLIHAGLPVFGSFNSRQREHVLRPEAGAELAQDRDPARRPQTASAHRDLRPR